MARKHSQECRLERRCGMNNEKAIKIFEEEIKHTEQHLRCENKSPEFYQEMKDWCEALKLGVKALKERQQVPTVKPCENCDLYFKAMTKEEMRKGGAENDVQ